MLFGKLLGAAVGVVTAGGLGAVLSDVFDELSKKVALVTTDHAVIGAVVESLRNEKGCSQKQLAEELKIGEATLSRIEKGDSALGVLEMIHLTKVLGVTPADMIDRVERVKLMAQQAGVLVKSDISFQEWKEMRTAKTVKIPGKTIESGPSETKVGTGLTVKKGKSTMSYSDVSIEFNNSEDSPGISMAESGDGDLMFYMAVFGSDLINIANEGDNK